MKLHDLLSIIYDNREKMLRKYPKDAKLVVDVHNNLVLVVDKLIKSNVKPIQPRGEVLRKH